MHAAKEKGEEGRRKKKSERSELKFGKRIRFQPGSVYLPLALCSSNRPLQLTSLPTTSLHERRRRRKSPPARPIRPRRAILYEGPFWAAIAAQKGPEYN